VSAAFIPKLLTVEEYERLRDPPGGRYELHHGEAVFAPFPQRTHKYLQRRLRKLLEPIYEPLGYTADTEYPYKPLPEHEVWGADVAVVPEIRDKATEQWLDGSPELVIEVKSRSNTKAELHDKAMTTLAGQGSAEFWVVDPRQKTITVYTKTSGIHVYHPGDSVPLPHPDSGKLAVSDIFSELR
jgi:Uma2 family endonuclease